MLDAAKIRVCAVVNTYVVDLPACLDTALGGFRTLGGVCEGCGLCCLNSIKSPPPSREFRRPEVHRNNCLRRFLPSVNLIAMLR